MKFKEGDKVLFLNEKGGGIVTRVVDEDIVHVSIEDGFEIPYAVGDLLKTGHEEAAPASRRDEPGIDTGKQSRLKMLTHQAVDIPEAVFLAMVPRNQDQVLAGAMDFYLVNHTPYFLYFGLMVNKSGHFQGIASGRIEPSSRHHLGKVERTEIEDWNHSLLQTVFYQDGKTEPREPINRHIVFKPVKIYKEESFAFSQLLHQKAYMVEV